MTDCPSTWLSQDLPYGKAKIRENTKYWKAIPLCGSVNFRLPTIRTTIEDWSYKAGLLVHMLYSHEFLNFPSVDMRLRLWLPVQFRNTKPFLATVGVNSKFSAALTSSLQIFTDHISLKEKQMECICRITCLEEDVLVVFPTGFDKRHDSESDKIVLPHWVVEEEQRRQKRNHITTLGII